jgi:hypothetical protein
VANPENLKPAEPGNALALKHGANSETRVRAVATVQKRRLLRQGPRAQELNKQAAKAHEQRYAGSKEVDEYGMRLDRRGFDATHGLLNSVHLYQHGYFKRTGHFAGDRKTLDPDGSLLKRYVGQLEMRLGEDGGYWAWTPTPTGVVFGIAARDDDFNNYWVYVAEEPPRGGIDADERWKHILEADYPYW